MAFDLEQHAKENWPVLLHYKCGPKGKFTHYLEKWQVLDNTEECEVTGKRMCSTVRPKAAKSTVCRCGHYKLRWRNKRA